MGNKAFVMLEAERIEAGPVVVQGLLVQQETRLFQGTQCVCVLLVNYPQGSPTWEAAMAGRETGGPGLPAVVVDSVAPDGSAPGGAGR